MAMTATVGFGSPQSLPFVCRSLPSLDFDDDREWTQWWIEDEEWRQHVRRWWRDRVPGYVELSRWPITLTGEQNES